MNQTTAYPARVPRTSWKFLRLFSSIMSFVFHPLLICFYMAVVQWAIARDYFAGISQKQFDSWLEMIFFASVFCPFLVILLLRLSKLISDAFMHAPKDRILPLAGTLVFYIWTFYFFLQKPGTPVFLESLFLGAILSIVLDFFINIFYKVSIHTTSAGMMPGNIFVMMLMMNLPILAVVVASVAALLVGLIRWWLGAHTLGQILLGYVIGISMQFCAYFILGSN